MNTNSKGIFIEEICEDSIINGKFRVTHIEKRTARTGSEFLQLELKDKTGKIIARIFSQALFTSDKDITLGGIYKVFGKYSKQFNSITINNLELCSENEYELSDYENTLENPDKLMEVIYNTINSIEDNDIKLILNLFFKEDEKFIKEFYKSPAASYYHHNYKHGLLEHTVNVLNICKKLTEIYPKLNRDLLYAGTILHDIGKIKVYKIQGLQIEYTEYGKLMEHIYLGAEMVKDKTRNKLINQNKINQIIHLILSHHGKKELGYGSAVNPQIPEAIALHHADNLDAKIKHILD
jgi:3'-5' exoribonuclease